MTQYGFFFDQSRCSGCRTCAVACKIWHELPPGPLKYLKIYEYEKGAFPDTRIHVQWMPCYHCEEPACVSNCPQEAIYKENKYGAVLIDSEQCTGCRICYDVCPYGSPVFESDESEIKAQKCNMCIDRLEMGLQPVCVMACPNRALDFGPLSSLIEKYGDIRELEDMPGSQDTSPAVLFKPHSEKRQLVAYNTEKALKLFMNRDQLPSVFKSSADILEIPDGMIGRSKLVIKHRTSAELMCNTRNDEG